MCLFGRGWRRTNETTDSTSSSIMRFQPIHQCFIFLSGICAMISAFLTLFNSNHAWDGSLQSRATLSRVVTMLYLFATGVAMVLVAVTKWKGSLEWLGMLRTFFGSGVFMLFLGFFILPMVGTFGLVAGTVIILCGVCSIACSFVSTHDAL